MSMLRLQCQCIVTGHNCGPSPYIFDIGLYLFLSADHSLKKNWLRKLRTIALPVYFMVLPTQNHRAPDSRSS